MTALIRQRHNVVWLASDEANYETSICMELNLGPEIAGSVCYNCAQSKVLPTFSNGTVRDILYISLRNPAF